MTSRSPQMRRFLDEDHALFGVDAPEELVPAEHFSGSDLARHRFAFYGEAFDLPQDIDWDHNPGTPHWGHDLNRFGFLVLHSPEDEEQARTMERLILDWIRKNGRARYKYTPYAWQNLLNVAIRIENWWRFLALRRSEGRSTLTPADWRTVMESVFGQLMILLRLIEKRGYESNWALIGLRAALYILYAIPALPHRKRLIRIAWRGLRTAAGRQILPDGVQQELSPHYHWVALELLASCRSMAQQAGDHDGRALDETIAAMARFLDALILPDGGIVAFGDTDFDYGPRIKAFLDRLHRDLPRPGPKAVSIFPYAGIAVVRQRQDGHLLAFDAGPLGTAHQHEDALSFWLTAFGEHFLIDPGRYLYDYSPQSMHSFLRSTAAHSTILVGGHGQAAGARKAGWRRSAPGWPHMAETDEKITLTGRYEEGYGEAFAGVRHERIIEIDKTGARWLIRDRLLGEGTIPVEARFQFAPCRWTLEDRAFRARLGRVELVLRFDAAWQPMVSEGSQSPKCGWSSSGLNRIEPAPCLLLDAALDLPAEIRTEISAALVDESILSSAANRLGYGASANRSLRSENMSAQASRKSARPTSAKKADAAAGTAVAKGPSGTGEAIEGGIEGGQVSAHAMFRRMQELLSERIDHTREKLKSADAVVSQLRDKEARLGLLEAEADELRKSEKALEIRLSQLGAENAALRARVASLQSSVAELEQEKSTAQARAAQIYQLATAEIGRVVKALLATSRGGVWKKKMTVSEQAKLLLANDIVDPDWYLTRHPDVAAAGMEPAVHYVLHGAEEGRASRRVLDDTGQVT